MNLKKHSEKIERAIKEINKELQVIKTVIKSNGFIYKIDKQDAIKIVVKKAAKKHALEIITLSKIGRFELTHKL